MEMESRLVASRGYEWGWGQEREELTGYERVAPRILDWDGGYMSLNM